MKNENICECGHEKKNHVQRYKRSIMIDRDTKPLEEAKEVKEDTQTIKQEVKMETPKEQPTEEPIKVLPDNQPEKQPIASCGECGYLLYGDETICGNCKEPVEW